MPECPKCKKKIDHLEDWSPAYRVFLLSVGPNGEPEVAPHDTVSMDKPDEYCCPECRETLFTHESEAVRFLKGLCRG